MKTLCVLLVLGIVLVSFECRNINYDSQEEKVFDLESPIEDNTTDKEPECSWLMAWCSFDEECCSGKCKAAQCVSW